MGLQLKGENEGNNVEVARRREAPMEDPWESGRLIDETYHTSVLKSDIEAKVLQTTRQNNKILPTILKILFIFVVVGLLIAAGKWIVSKVKPEGKDITGILRMDETAIAKELGVTFTEKSDWVSRIQQYSSGKITVNAADDIGIVYLDGKKVGVHVESKAYTMFGVQLGDGEKNVYDNIQYNFDSFHSVLNDMARGKTTTYYYYNKQQNDCVAVTINDTTNRVVGLTYFSDYKRIVETLDF